MAIVLLIVAYIGLGWLRSPASQGFESLTPDTLRLTPAQLAQLKIEPVRFGANATLVRASGSIAVDADHSTPILLPFSGQVVRVFVEPGQRVSQGSPLLAVASPELVDARNTLLTAAAQVTSTGEVVQTARANSARMKAIYETAGGALKDYLQAQADLVTAQANYRAAQSALRSAQDRLGLFGKSAGEIRSLQSSSVGLGGQSATVYRSPVSGVVADRSVSPGQFLSAGGNAALMTITDLSRVWLVAQLPESEAANARLGDEVEVTTPSVPGRAFRARIDNISAALDPNTHRLPVRATVDNAEGLLKPQMFASFTIRRALGGEPGVLVPAQAIIHEGETSRAWVQSRDGLLHARVVQVGDTEGGLTRVARGLNPGDRIVVAGALFVNEAGIDR
ncbi:efflux RND transporter periplasmic adaptor subunit [Novosphingobium sp.]|uniref:efflux RND transporter periplasmic adaptor subunit n=1 Tax=Novosphingobium sp. TaxID=1874826 RepID=UPI0025D36150|nr:efflux RND transporter periplasmic adaptor subunit [Novosphingobium sp.]